jgi:hypothetical protein
MSAETVTRTIQLILAPVVMVSACSIFIGGLLTHYAAINSRIRMMARERFDLLRSASDARLLVDERLDEIDLQLPALLARHERVHHALLAAYLGILILVASMCVIALSASVSGEWLVSLVLVLFVAGILAVLMSVLLMWLEVRVSHQAVGFEVRRVLLLRRQPDSLTGAPAAGTDPLTVNGTLPLVVHGTRSMLQGDHS